MISINKFTVVIAAVALLSLGKSNAFDRSNVGCFIQLTNPILIQISALVRADEVEEKVGEGLSGARGTLGTLGKKLISGARGAFSYIPVIGKLASDDKSTPSSPTIPESGNRVEATTTTVAPEAGSGEETTTAVAPEAEAKVEETTTAAAPEAEAKAEETTTAAAPEAESKPEETTTAVAPEADDKVDETTTTVAP